MQTWQLIDTAPQREGFAALVDNGERIGEAVLYGYYGYDESDDDYAPKLVWRWANHGSCGCCWDNMSPQPTVWQPLPERTP